MYVKNHLLLIFLLICVLFSNIQKCNAAYEPEILDEVTGVGWSLSAKDVNSIVEADKPGMIELWNNEKGELYIKFIKAGDFYLTETFVSKLDGKTYKTTTFMHVIDGLTMEDFKYRTNAFRFAVKMLRLINEEREKVGVPPLKWSNELMQAGAIRAKEIEQNFSHTRPDGTSFKTVVNNTKYENCHMAENIARGQSKVTEVLPVWLNSPEHRANILNPKFKKFGLGYYYDDNKFPVFHFWSQLFSS
ncbi:CAP domain-containing protein [Megamonas funiformis]|nr:CAP domain-containing protein [Megamonas funiformis]